MTLRFESFDKGYQGQYETRKVDEHSLFSGAKQAGHAICFACVEGDSAGSSPACWEIFLALALLFTDPPAHVSGTIIC